MSAEKSMRKRRRLSHLPADLRAIVGELAAFLDSNDIEGRIPCNAKCGVYAFFDYDGEPIYVGQTSERLRVRIRRHLTNQRTDAVAMRVLDPIEVAEIEVWPLWHLQTADSVTVNRELDAAEYSLYLKVLGESPIGRVLNEKRPTALPPIMLPTSHRGTIIPAELRERFGHPDVRIARRAAIIASLSAIIMERDVSIGLRNTLVTQAQRLERLASQRFEEIYGSFSPEDAVAELVATDEEE